MEVNLKSISSTKLKNDFKAKCAIEGISMRSKLEELVSKYTYEINDRANKRSNQPLCKHCEV